MQGLRNVGPTFIKMTKAALKDQVSRNILSYVDGIVVVSKKKENYIADLAETFVNMREAKLKLNSEKCVFGITKGKVLGCLVSTKGIEANPDKIRAITQMQPVTPCSEIAGTKPPYVCPGCFIHTYSNNVINRFHVQ
jgi:hypothetical protein